MPLTKQTAHRKDINAGIGEMQHRHFATVATIIRKLHAHGELDAHQVVVIAKHFADNLALSNPRFDRERFLAACE